jgi:hypothetical protein
VLLLDRADDRPMRTELADRLRRACEHAVPEAAQRCIPFAPGLDARGRRFTPPRPAGKSSEGP